jgi:hypothetical protein
MCFTIVTSILFELVYHTFNKSTTWCITTRHLTALFIAKYTLNNFNSQVLIMIHI